jgi:hypothetical protein
MAAELGPFIQEEHAIVGQRHFTRHRHVAPADPPCIRDGVVGRAKRAGRDQRGAIPREAGDTMDAGRLNAFCPSALQLSLSVSPSFGLWVPYELCLRRASDALC